jgi:hypothetical protein
MQLFSWLRKRMTTRPQTRRTPLRPQFEALEGRDLPSFSSPVTYAAYGTAALLAADADGDGKPDLISLVNNGRDLAVQLNNGKGSFGPAYYYYTGAEVGYTGTALALGVNAQGVLNAVVASYNAASFTYAGPGADDSISWLQDNGKGSFTSVGTYDVIPDGSPITSLALTDVSGNGELDVVAGASDGAVYVARPGNGSPFGAVQTYNVPAEVADPGPPPVAVGDFNGDGKPDLVVANPGIDMSADSVSVLLNNGNGTFGAAQSYTVGGSPTAVALGDFNGDGKLDIVTANANSTMSVLLGQGNGTFAPAQNYAIGGPANSVAVADFNHDGQLDVVTTGAEIDLLLNNGNGTFGAYQKVGPAGSNVVAADFNGDGYPDLAQVDASDYTIDVLYNNPDGSLAGAGFPLSTTAGVAHSFTVTALNADGTVNTGYGGTVQFSSSDPQAVLPANYKFTAADQGLHTFSVTLKTAGTQSLTATDTANASLVASEPYITVTPAAAVTLVLGNVPSGLSAGGTFNLMLTAEDAYGNTATGYTGTVHFTSSDPQAVLPADFTFTSGNAGSAFYFTVTLKTAGKQSVTVTDTMTNSITGTASGITVFPAAASKFIVSAPSSVASGTKFSLTLTVEDAYGNVVPYYGETVHFSSSDSTAKLPGNYSFSNSDAGVHTFKSAFVLRKKGIQTITITDTQISSLTVTVSIDVL